MGRLIGTMDLPDMDRRGKTVVFSSMPMRSRLHIEMEGPEPVTAEKPRLSLVMWNVTTGQWGEHESTVPHGATKKYSEYTPYDNVFRHIYYGELFQDNYKSLCIVGAYGMNPLFDTIKVRAKIARPTTDGGNETSADYVDVPVSKVEVAMVDGFARPLSIVHVQYPLIKIKGGKTTNTSPSADLSTYVDAEAIADGDAMASGKR